MKWTNTNLGTEIELKYGKPLPEQNRAIGLYNVFGSNGAVGTHNEPLVDGPGIIVGRKGSVGKIAFSEADFWPIDTTYFVENKNQNNWYYLYYQLLFLKLDKLNSHSTVPGLNREQAYPITFIKPPQDEQLRIAAILHKIQKAIEVENKLLQATRELNKSTMKQLFTHGLRGEKLKETEIGLVPESWAIKKLEQVTTIERGKFSHRPRNDPEYYGGQTPFVQTGDVVKSGGRITTYSQTLNEKGLSVSRLFSKGTILITIAANIGDTGILEFDSAFPDSIIGMAPFDGIFSEYLEYYLRTQKTKMNEQAPKGTQKNINIEFLRPWLVPVPKIDEQQEIAHILQTIDQKIEVHEKKKSTLQDLFKTMLHKLMTAEIRVHDLDIETSEVV